MNRRGEESITDEGHLELVPATVVESLEGLVVVGEVLVSLLVELLLLDRFVDEVRNEGRPESEKHESDLIEDQSDQKRNESHLSSEISQLIAEGGGGETGQITNPDPAIFQQFS